MYFPLIHIDAGITSASNGMLIVSMPKAFPEGSDQSWLGVLAQEVFEVRYKWAHLLNVVGTIIVDGRKFYGAMEIHSHVVEALVAARFDDRDVLTYLELMLTLLDHPEGYRKVYGYFAGMTREDIRTQMTLVRPTALEWVSTHADFFEAVKRARVA